MSRLETMLLSFTRSQSSSAPPTPSPASNMRFGLPRSASQTSLQSLSSVQSSVQRERERMRPKHITAEDGDYSSEYLSLKVSGGIVTRVSCKDPAFKQLKVFKGHEFLILAYILNRDLKVLKEFLENTPGSIVNV